MALPAFVFGPVPDGMAGADPPKASGTGGFGPVASAPRSAALASSRGIHALLAALGSLLR
jgi:hypothetical protein